MYAKNAASPKQISIGTVVQISDGAVQTSGVTVRIKPDGVAEGDGAGTTAYSTDGVVLYTPTQAETNYASFILIAKKTGCYPVDKTIITTESSTFGRTSLGAILGTALTEGATGRIAAAWQAAWNVASSVWTSASVNQTGDSYTRLGAPVGASISADIAAAQAVLDTLSTRLTSARAGYLDNLNVGGVVASQADVNALNQSASRRVILTSVQQFERPESGTSVFTIEMRTYDGDGAAVNADSTPSLAVTGIISGDLSANLSAGTNPATGLYSWTYTVETTDTLEQLRFAVSPTIGGSQFPLSSFSQVVDFVAATWTTDDRVMLTGIFDKLPTNDIADQTLLTTVIGSPIQAGDLTYAGFWSYATRTLSSISALASEIRAAVGLNSANLDAQLTNLPGLVSDNFETEYILQQDTDNTFYQAWKYGGRPLMVSTVSGTPTSTEIRTISVPVEALSNPSFFNESLFFIVSGNGKNQSPKPISSFTNPSSGVFIFTFEESWAVLPTAGDTVSVLLQHVHTKGSLAAAVWDALTSGITTTGSVGKRILDLISGMTNLPAWLGALAGKTADTTTRAEINATTAGAGYLETTDSLQAIRDRGDAAWTTGAGGGGSPTVSVVVPAAVAAASTEEDEVVAYRGDYLARSWTNLGDFSAVTEIWFTVKDDPKRADSEAYLQIKQTVGLTYLSKAVAAVADVSKAAITIDDAPTGDITVTVDAELMAQLPPAKNWYFDIQIQQPSLTKTSTVVAGKWNLKSDVTRAIT